MDQQQLGIQILVNQEMGGRVSELRIRLCPCSMQMYILKNLFLILPYQNWGHVLFGGIWYVRKYDIIISNDVTLAKKKQLSGELHLGAERRPGGKGSAWLAIAAPNSSCTGDCTLSQETQMSQIYSSTLAAQI